MVVTEEPRGLGRTADSVQGIIPQSLVDIFKAVADKSESEDSSTQWSVRIQYCEVYNENVFDLLEPSGAPLAVRENPSEGTVTVAGLSAIQASNPDEVGLTTSS